MEIIIYVVMFLVMLVSFIVMILIGLINKTYDKLDGTQVENIFEKIFRLKNRG